MVPATADNAAVVDVVPSSSSSPDVAVVLLNGGGGDGGGNPILTRGTFGEISLAACRRKLPQKKKEEEKKEPNAEQREPDSNNNQPEELLTVVVVKTLRFHHHHPQQDQRHATTTSADSTTTDDWSELAVIQRLDPHPNIVSLVSSSSSDASGPNARNPTMVFEYCPTDLQLSLEWRRRRRILVLAKEEQETAGTPPSVPPPRRILSPLSMSTVRTVCRDAVSALEHCHSRGIVHGDVKPGNLLVSCRGVVQLCDFGIAKRAYGDPPDDGGNSNLAIDNGNNNNEVGEGLCTLWYRPPELLLGAQRLLPSGTSRPSVDVYSAGTVLAELLSEQPLFRGNNEIGQLSEIFDVLGTPTTSSWPSVQRECPDYGKVRFVDKPRHRLADAVPRIAEGGEGGGGDTNLLPDLLESMLKLDPSERISAADALRHPWLQLLPLRPPSSPSSSARSMLAEELIPPALEEPVLLSPPPPSSNSTASPSRDPLRVAKKQALDLARIRREFLSKLQ